MLYIYCKQYACIVYKTIYKIATAFSDKIGIWSHFEKSKRDFDADISYRTKKIIKSDQSINGRSNGQCVQNNSEVTIVPRKGLIPPHQMEEETDEFGNLIRRLI